MNSNKQILGQITMILKPEFLGHFGRVPLLNHIFEVTLAKVAIICPDTSKSPTAGWFYPN